MNLQASYEQALDEVDLLEFGIESCEDFKQQIFLAAQIVKKLYLIEILRIMQPIKTQLTETDLVELRSFLKEWTSKVDVMAKAFQNGNRIDCDEAVLDILDRILPYLNGRLKKLTFYIKSKQIEIYS